MKVSAFTFIKNGELLGFPFVESIINTTDRGDLMRYGNQGDGSEIIGIEFIQNHQSSGLNLITFFGNFNNSMYSLNKKIYP